MDFYSLDSISLQKLNTLTKYPSIPTFHKTDEKGMLTNVQEFLSQQNLIASEKIDGTNSRIIFDHCGNYIVGIREHFIWGSRDLIVNDGMGILPNLVIAAEKIKNTLIVPENHVLCVFGESYGGNINGAKNYTKDISKRGYRVFDVAICDLSLLNRSLDQISHWRDSGGQNFYSQRDLTSFINNFSLESVPVLKADLYFNREINHDEAYNLLKEVVPHTYSELSDDRLNKAEGIVVRTEDRSLIAKLRYADYERAFKTRPLKNY